MNPILAGVIAFLLGYVAYRIAQRPKKPAWLPAELRNARLVMVEKDLFTRQPYPIAGRPDLVFRIDDGSLVPLELKNRNHKRAYDTDIGELSLQAWLLRRNGHRTATHAYVAVRNTESGETDAIRVNLWNDQECESAIARYLDLIAGRVMPRRCVPQRCGGCGHKQYC